LDHPNSVLTLANLGNAFVSLGDFDDGKLMLRRALKIQEQVGGERSAVATLHVHLANAEGQEDPKLRAKLLKRALHIQRDIMVGAEHPDIAATLMALANTYCFVGKPQTELLTQALKDTGALVRIRASTNCPNIGEPW
jgi:hypothetical protein